MGRPATRTEFVDSVPRQIRFRPQFVAQFAEPFHPQKALRLYLYRQLLDPRRSASHRRALRSTR